MVMLDICVDHVPFHFRQLFYIYKLLLAQTESKSTVVMVDNDGFFSFDFISGYDTSENR